jgi:hypothetical protein
MCFVTESAKLWSVAFLLAHSALAQQNNQDSNSLDCVAELNIPVYEGILWRARISGDVSVSINIGKGGSSTVRATGPHTSLVNWVEQEITKSTFRAVCDGRIINLFLSYHQEGPITESPVNRIKFRPPNRFEIIASPPPPIHTVN